MQKTLPPLDVRPVRAFADNYIWLIESPRVPGRVVAVDPGDAAPVRAELRRSGASLAAILLTHHHPDHIGGVEGLLELGSVPVIGPEDARIALRSRTVRDGERCDLPDLGLGFEILAVPGHTLSHIAFWGHGALFCGDTLFSAGCGRMFESGQSHRTRLSGRRGAHARRRCADPALASVAGNTHQSVLAMRHGRHTSGRRGACREAVG